MDNHIPLTLLTVKNPIDDTGSQHLHDERLKNNTEQLQGQGEYNKGAGDHNPPGATAITPTREYTQKQQEDPL